LGVARLAAQPDAFVVVVNCHRQRLLGAPLPDDVAVELLDDLLGPRVAGSLRSLFLGDDVVAKGHTLVADEDARPGNQFSHLAAPFSAEGAMEVIHHQSLLHRRGALANSMSRRGPRRARGPTEGGASEEFVSSTAPRISPAERLPSTSLE